MNFMQPGTAKTKSFILGTSMVLGALAAGAAMISSGDYSHATEAIAGLLGGLALIVNRDATQKVINKK